MTNRQKRQLRTWADEVERTADDAVIVGGTVLVLLMRLIEETCDE